MKRPDKYINPHAKDIPIIDTRERPGMDVAAACSYCMSLMKYQSVPVISAGKCKLCGEKMVEHVVKEGARYHVHMYSLKCDEFGKYSTTTCSTKECEDNHGYGKCVLRTQKSVNKEKLLEHIRKAIKKRGEEK
jgi:hypothetical protein